LRVNGLKGGLKRSLKWLLLLSASIAAGTAGDNEKTKFEVQPAASYPHHQTSDKLTIAAQPAETDAETHDAFGMLNPNSYGILPVLIVMQNDGPDAIKLDHLKFEYITPDGQHVEATPAGDVKYIHGTRAPNRLPGTIVIKKKVKNPLDVWEIEGRAFTAKMLPAGQSASGYVYFQVDAPSAAANVDISGMSDAVTSKEILYFEIPMSGK
jgi:hypothetical protein